MKKSGLFIVCLLSAFGSIAQPILTAENTTPQIGSHLYYFSLSHYPEGNAGANQTWYFSHINYQTSRLANVIPCSGSVQCGSFPGTNLVYSDTNSEYF